MRTKMTYYIAEIRFNRESKSLKRERKMRKRRVVYLILPLLLLLFSIFSVIGLTVTGVVNDETPPEAVITFYPQTFRIGVFGVDDVDLNVDVTSVIVEEEHDETTIKYILTDDAGNYLNLTLELKEKKEHVEVEILELNYNGEVFVPEENSYKVYWQPVQPLRHLHQKIHLDDQVKVKTQYNAHKNETRIDIEGERQLKERLVLPGLVIISLVTDKGSLNYKIEIVDSEPPEIVSVFFETPEYDESAEIRAYVTDVGSGVDFVILSYSANTVDWVDLTMNLVDGFYVAEIPPFPYNTTLKFVISAFDRAGNSAVPWEDSYTVTDSRSPTISFVEHSPASPNYNETVTVFAIVTEPINASGVRLVSLSYWDGSVWTNRTMTLVDTRYTATISALPYGTSVQYIVYAFDNAENWKVSEARFYQVTDSIPPLIGIHPTWNPREPSAEEQVNVSVSVTEPLGASGVKNVTLWYRTDEEWKSAEMTLKGGNWTAIIPGQEADVTVRFYIESYDNAGNLAKTLPYHYTTKARIGWPLAWLAVIILLIIALTITALYLLYTRRRKKTATKLGSKPIVTLYVPTETIFG